MATGAEKMPHDMQHGFFVVVGSELVLCYLLMSAAHERSLQCLSTRNDEFKAIRLTPNKAKRYFGWQ